MINMANIAFIMDNERMSGMKKKVRIAVKALIIEDDRLLCIKKKSARGVFYLLPGGGQEFEETLDEALARECQEEIGAKVQVNGIQFVREFIASHHDKRNRPFHQVDIIFACKLIDRNPDVTSQLPDYNQVAIEWIPIHQLEKVGFQPSELAIHLRSHSDHVVYLGNV